ncbi:MAG: zf-HC2 domain-containing protein [Acidimicrobiales bacterium]
MTGAPPLTCRQLVDAVTDYLDDAMAAPERARFADHLAACANCEAYLDQIRTTIAVAGRLTEGTARQSLGPAAMAELMEAFRTWRRGP